MTDVAAVYNRIDEIETIETAIQSINDGELNAVAAVEGLTVQGPGSTTDIPLVLQDLFEAVAGAAADIGLSPAGAVIAYAVGLRVDRRNLILRYGGNLNPGQQVSIEFSKLQTALDTVFAQSIEGLNSDLAKIVDDSGC